MKDVEKPEGGTRDLFDRRAVRVTLFVAVPLAIFVLACVGIRVSQLGIDHTIVVMGQKHLVAGAPAAMRITLIADDSGFFLPDRVDARLVRGERRHELFSGALDAEGHALGVDFTVPVMTSGPAVLELDIGFDERRRIVRCPVEIVDAPVAQELVALADAPPGESPILLTPDGGSIQAFTEDRGAPTGLTSVLFLRALDERGEPASVPLELELPGDSSSEGGALPTRIRTDRLGLAALPIKPVDLDFPVKVEGARRPGEEPADGGVGAGEPAKDGAFLLPKVVYSGISAAVHAPVVAAGEPVRITVSQITRGGAVYADVFHEGRWVMASSSWVDAAGRAELVLSPPVGGLLRVQITNSALVSGRTIAVRHVLVLDGDQDETDGLRAVLDRLGGPLDGAWARSVAKGALEGGAGFDRRLASAFALSRLYEGHQEVGRLISSRRDDDAELGAFKARVQRGVMIVIILLGVGSALAIGTAAAAAHRRRRRLEREILADSVEAGTCEAAEAFEVGARRDKLRTIVQGAVLFFIMIGAFAAIALLVDTMTWGR